MKKNKEPLEQLEAVSDHFEFPRVIFRPPLCEDFEVYGDEGTQVRARKWALDRKLVQIVGVNNCAHSFYMTRCPGRSSCNKIGFDHTTMWITYDRPFDMFILTQPYCQEIPETMVTYARAHGLGIYQGGTGFDSSGGLTLLAGDGWYSEGSIPIILRADRDTLYPLERLAVQTFYAMPIDWPSEEGE